MELENLPFTEIAKIIIPGILAFVSGWYFSRRDLDKAYSSEAYTKIYNPISKMIEPYKYKKDIDPNQLLVVLKLILYLINENDHLIHDDVRKKLEAVMLRINNSREFNRMFDIFCLSVEKKHRKLKRTLGYPLPWGIHYLLVNSSFRRLRARG